MQVIPRIEAIKLIKEACNERTAIVASNGMVSRDLYALGDRDLNFYVTGAMGTAVAVGVGLALNTTRPVVVITGDGAALMGLGSLSLAEHLDLMNLHVFILSNRCHASTGGQRCLPTPYGYGRVIHITKDKGDSPRIPLKIKDMVERFKNAISK